MALQKAKELASGVTGEYWKIIRASDEYLETGCYVKVAMYKDAAAKVAGKTPLDYLEFNWVGEDNPCTEVALSAEGMTPRKLQYAKLKTLPEFDGAVDLL